MTPSSRQRGALLVLAVVSACRCETPAPVDAGAADGGPEPALDGGRDASVPGVDGGPGPNEFCLGVARARCERERTCRFLDDAQQPTCLARLEAECLGAFARVRAGSAIFDPVAALACVGAAGAPRCVEGPRALAAACEVHRVFQAAGSGGAGCIDSGDCLSGFCFGTARQCRTCRPYRTSPQPCTTTDQRCDPRTAFCPAGGGGRACAPLLADGQACGSSSECATSWCNSNGNLPGPGSDTCGRLPAGAPCGDPGDCLPGHWCRGFAYDGAMVTPGVCTARTPAALPCENQPDDDGCAEPGTCLDGRCGSPAPYSLDAGQECERLDHCQEALFCLGLEALAPDGGRSLRSGTCTPRLPPGQACDFTTYVDTDCDETSTCGLDGRCVVRGSADAGCQARFECRDFLACSLTDSRCTPFLTLGEGCDAPGLICADGPGDAQCVVNANGTGATCVPLLVEGVSCDPLDPGRCASSRCFGADGGASATCQAPCVP